MIDIKHEAPLKPGRCRDDNFDWLAKVKPRRGDGSTKLVASSRKREAAEASGPGKT